MQYNTLGTFPTDPVTRQPCAPAQIESAKQQVLNLVTDTLRELHTRVETLNIEKPTINRITRVKVGYKFRDNVADPARPISTNSRASSRVKIPIDPYPDTISDVVIWARDAAEVLELEPYVVSLDLFNSLPFPRAGAITDFEKVFQNLASHCHDILYHWIDVNCNQ